jgi:mandelate racemase
MTNAPTLTVRQLRARAVNAPLAKPITTSSATIESAPLVLIDLETEQGVTGHSYVFCYTTVVAKPVADVVVNLNSMLKGMSAAPADIEALTQLRFRLLGTAGLLGIALAGVDMAAWDALARAAGVPLVRLLGGERRATRAYNSCGMGGVKLAIRDAEETLASGFPGMKIKIGYPELADDIAAIRAAKRTTDDKVALMVDYNQCLTVPEAIRRCHALDDEGVEWIEEPVRADDYAGHAAVARATTTPIQMGENWFGTHEMAKSIAAHASDLAMPEAMKIGGVSGWLRAAALAHAAGLPVSSHLLIEISAHLFPVTPTTHWLEWLDVASGILREPPQCKNGVVTPSAAPGTGVEWNEEAVRRYLIP